MFRRFMSISVFVVLVFSCSKKSSDDTGSGAGSSDSTVAGLGTLNGQLMMEQNGKNVPAANANVTVQSHPELTTTADANGNVSMNNLVPGTLTIYAATTTNGSASLADSSNARAAQFKDVVVGSGTPTTLSSNVVLTEPGSISGTVGLLNNPNNVTLLGITVYVPGTSFSAKTDANGNFSITSVPAGSYDVLQFDQQGLTSSEVDNVTVTSAQNTNVGTVYMSLSTGPSGVITGISGTASVAIGGTNTDVLQSNTVTVNLKYDSRAVLMMVADESAFINVNWVPVASSYTFTSANNSAAVADFANDGQKNVFVKFADQNGLQSSVYEHDFVIDTQVPTLNGITILNGWAQSATTTVYIDVDATDAGSGVAEIMFSNTSDFSGSSWQTFTPRMNWTLTAGQGSKQVWAKVRDYMGNQSNVSTATIDLGDYTLIANKTYSSTINLNQAQSPFLISDNITFGGNLVIEAGAAINIANGYKLTANGVVTAVGNSSSHIVFELEGAPATNCGFGGTSDTLDFSSGLPGVSENNFFNYVDFVLISTINFNGGTINNSHFDSSLCTSGTLGQINKTGLDNLVIDNNTFSLWTQAISVQGGLSNTTFTNNTGTVASAFQQSGTATGSVFSGNTFTVSNTLYSIGNGTITTTGNTITGSLTYVLNIYGGDNYTFDFSNQAAIPTSATNAISYSGSGSLTVSNLTINANCDVFANHWGSGKLTILNSSISGCSTSGMYPPAVIYAGSTGTLTVSNSVINNSPIALLYNPNITNPIGTVSFNYNDITVSNALVSSSGNSAKVSSFNNNNITCSNSPSMCDLFYKELSSVGSPQDTLTFSNNNMTCEGTTSSGCRGFTYYMQYSDSVTAVFTLNITGNYWATGTGLKPLNGNLSSYNSYVSGVNTTTATDIEIYLFTPSTSNIITLNPLTIPAYTTLSSAVTNAGPQ